MNLFQLLTQLRDSLGAGDVNASWRAVVRVGDLLFGGHHDEAVTEGADPALVESVAAEIDANCKAKRGARATGADGTRLDALLQLVQTLLPLILSLLQKK